MNKYITLMLIIMGNFVFSQVGIATQTPHASSDLELGETNKALYLNRVANPVTDIANPQPGMMLYDTTEHCVKVYGGDPAKWSDCLGGAIAPPTNPAGAGSLSGKVCFDVVEQFVSDACGQLTPRLPQKADFSQTATNTQTYIFTPTGTVSNVRFVYINTNGQVIQSITPNANYSGSLTSSQTATATVVFYNNLNAAAAGLSRELALTGDIYVIYNDSANNTGTDKQLKLTAKVQDCSCCGAMTFAKPDGTGGIVWKEFMCHNLGADTSADPFIPSKAIHGMKMRWGINPATIPIADFIKNYVTANQDQVTYPNNNSNIPGWTTTVYNPLLILPHGAWYDANKDASDPCPAGYRVPSSKQWEGVFANNTKTFTAAGTWNWTEQNGNMRYGSGLMLGNSLFLPAEGQRGYLNGTLNLSGATGLYWSSTPDIRGFSTPVYAYRMAFGYFAGNPGYQNIQPSLSVDAPYLYSVRCIAE